MTTIWVLGTEPRFSTRTASVLLTCWASSPVPWLFIYLFKIPSSPPILRVKPSALWILGNQFTTEPYWQPLFFMGVWMWHVWKLGDTFQRLVFYACGSRYRAQASRPAGECCYQLSRLLLHLCGQVYACASVSTCRVVCVNQLVGRVHSLLAPSGSQTLSSGNWAWWQEL